MDSYEATGNYYVLGHVKLITGLSERTIRNHISSGFLTGEKINGVWHFTPEQVEAFISHPSVRPGILAKKNALVYDFLLDNKKKSTECCIILDIPEDDSKNIAEFFCYTICNENYKNIQFSFDSHKRSTPRVILKGDTNVVLDIVNKYVTNFSIIYKQ